MSNLLISLVIPTYNQGKYIEETIVSILGQSYKNFELIIIDGGSTDETLSVVEKYSESIHYFVSERDRGQAHAINKGFRVARGEVFAWLNSDDLYFPCTLDKICNIAKDLKEPYLIYGGCLHFKESTEKAFGYLPPEFSAERIKYFDYITQPSTFWSRSLWETVGELNESFHYVLDWDWFIRASKACSFTPIRDYLSLYRLHENHKSGSGGSRRLGEIIKIIEMYADEDWVQAYKETYKFSSRIKLRLRLLSKLRLSRFRQLAYPMLFLTYGSERVETALEMLQG